MELFEALFTRRSIRKYTAEPVSREDVRTMLKAAMLSPSAGNRQPWHFVVVDDRATLDRIAAEHPYAKMAADARWPSWSAGISMRKRRADSGCRTAPPPRKISCWPRAA